MNISPEYWGTGLWRMMYSVAYAYPKKPGYNDMIHIRGFMNNLVHIIPCENCRTSFQNYMRNKPVFRHTNNSETLLEWINVYHNQVNKKLGKQSVPLEKIIKEIDEYNKKANLSKDLPEDLSEVNAEREEIAKNFFAKNPSIEAKVNSSGCTNCAKKSVRKRTEIIIKKETGEMLSGHGKKIAELKARQDQDKKKIEEQHRIEMDNLKILLDTEKNELNFKQNVERSALGKKLAK